MAVSFVSIFMCAKCLTAVSETYHSPPLPLPPAPAAFIVLFSPLLLIYRRFSTQNAFVAQLFTCFLFHKLLLIGFHVCSRPLMRFFVRFVRVKLVCCRFNCLTLFESRHFCNCIDAVRAIKRIFL